MPAPNTGYLDQFNRANEDPLSGGGNWAGSIFDPAGGDTQLQLVSNAVLGRLTTSESYWAAATFGPRSEVWFTLATRPTDQGVALYTNLQSPGTSGVDGYFFVVYTLSGTDHGELYRVDNNVATQLGATVTLVLTSGDQFWYSQIDGVLTGYQRSSGIGPWVAVIVRTDDTYSQVVGNVGISIDRAVAVLDDVGGGTVVSSNKIPPQNMTRPRPFAPGLAR